MNYILSKDWDDGQREESRRALRVYRELLRDSGHPYSRLFDKHFDYALQNIDAGAIEGVLVGQYIVLFSVAPSWLSPEPAFVELMLLRLDWREPSDFDDVITCVETIAASRGCGCVLLGNASLRPGLLRKYRQRDYTQSNMELIKEIPNG